MDSNNNIPVVLADGIPCRGWPPFEPLTESYGFMSIPSLSTKDRTINAADFRPCLSIDINSKDGTITKTIKVFRFYLARIR